LTILTYGTLVEIAAARPENDRRGETVARVGLHEIVPLETSVKTRFYYQGSYLSNLVENQSSSRIPEHDVVETFPQFCAILPSKRYHSEVWGQSSRRLAATIHHWLKDAAPVQSDQVDAPACGRVSKPHNSERYTPPKWHLTTVACYGILGGQYVDASLDPLYIPAVVGLVNLQPASCREQSRYLVDFLFLAVLPWMVGGGKALAGAPGS